MNKSKIGKIILVIIPIIMVGCLVYLPHIGELGLYRDDWDNYYNALRHGADFLKEHYQADRPADGILLAEFFRIFGTNTSAYLVYNLVCRILGSVFFALALLALIPHRPEIPAAAGIFTLIFPGFLEQTMGFAYIPHRTALCCFMLSLLLTVPVLECRNRFAAGLSALFSVALAFINMVLMEYYIGMEVYRLLLIFLLLRKKGCRGGRLLLKTLLGYLPWMICILGFVYWRVFLFSAERVGADLMEDYITPILAHPRYEIASILVRILKSVWKLFAGVWSVPAINVLNDVAMKPFVRQLLSSILIALLTVAFMLPAALSDPEDPEKDDGGALCAKLILYGFFSGSVAIIPMIVAGRDINFYIELDRFSLVGMIGAVLFLVGILRSIRKNALSFGVIGVLIMVFSFVQIQNRNSRIAQWHETQNFWQQLIWRAPMIEKNTTITAHGSIQIQEDLDVSIPASLIYYPNEPDPEYIPIGAEVLYSGTVPKIKLGGQESRELRKIIVQKDYQKLLVLTKPNSSSCLRVIDGNRELYSELDGSAVSEVGAFSKTGLISDPGYSAEIPFFLGKEAEHGWCYYYEKMELALQMDDSETAAALADEAAEQNLRPEDIVEWVPVIDAYSRVGRSEEAAEKWIFFWENEYTRLAVCDYFKAADDPETYGPVIGSFCR